MIKRLLSSVLMLAAVVGAGAQTTVSRAQLPAGYTQNRVVKAPARIKQGTMPFTYYPGGDITNVKYISGTKQKNTYNMAMYIPAEYAGKTISKVSFILYSTAVLTDVKVWESSTLPASADEAEVQADEIVKKSISEQNIPQSYGSFSTPITVPEGGCYVGYSFRVTDVSSQPGQSPVFVEDLGEKLPGTCFEKIDNGTWVDRGAEGSTIAMAAELSGEFYENGASVKSVGSSVTTAGGKSTVSVKFANTGLNNITRISYVVKDLATGTESNEVTKAVSTVKKNSSGSFTFVVEAPQEVAEFKKELKITKVNNVANEQPNSNVKEFGIVTMSKSYTRKVLEEEATATGCGPCAAGYAGYKYLGETYPDTWIGIAAHVTGVNWADPMYCPDYAPITNKAQGVPTAWLDRGKDLNPYFGSTNSTMLGIDAAFKKAAAVPTEGMVKVDAEFSDDTKNIINVTTDVEFSINSTTSDYGIAYVLLANGLKKPANSTATHEWYQNDGYYGAKGAESEPYIYEWCKGDGVEQFTIQGYKFNLKTDMVFDHVAIAAVEIENGIAGSVSLPIVDGQKQQHKYQFDISKGITSMTVEGDDLIQDKDRLEVVAILINRATGAIVNADKVALGDFSGVNSAVNEAADATEVARYSLDGVKLSAPQKGLNIVKMSDGRTVKVLVK